MNETETLVVGSGTSILNYELGDVIDTEFDNVVRFNRFEKTYEEHAEYAGKKVDTVVTNTNYSVAKEFREKLKSNKFRDMGVNEIYVTWTYRRSLRRAMNLIRNQLFNYTICDYPSVLSLAKDYAKNNGLNDMKFDQTFTSGLIMIIQKLFIEDLDHIYIHGFDNLEMERVPSKHYYDGLSEGNNVHRAHDLYNEAIMIEDLVQKNRITRLCESKLVE